MKEQMIFSVESEARSRERGRAFAYEVMAKIMEDVSMSILIAEARRRKQIIYKKDLEDSINERKRHMNSAVAKLKVEWEETKVNEGVRAQNIQEMRQKLIEDHLGQVF